MKLSTVLIKNIFLLCLIPSLLFSQDTTKSAALKYNVPQRRGPLVKPIRSSYPLLAGYLLQQEAYKEDPFAQHELGLRYLLGIGFPKDTLKASYWIKQAAIKKIPSASFNYSIVLLEGIGAEWNPFEAYEHTLFAANSGMPEAQYSLGLFYSDNFVLNKNLDETYRWMKKSFENGYEPAGEVIKNLKEMGVNPTDSKEEDTIPIVFDDSNASYRPTAILENNLELDFYEFALDTLSDENSSTQLKKLLDKDKEKLINHLGVRSIYNSGKDTSGLGILLAAANNGSPEALLLLGRMHETGIGVAKDSVEAAAYYIKSYRLGGYKAAEFLVKMVRNNKFYNNLKKKVDKKNAQAMYVWAALTGLGLDFSITEKQVFEFMKKASELNYLPAIVEMGLIYYNGVITKKDTSRALQYWRKAESMGSIEAQIRIDLLLILESKNDEIIKKAFKDLKKISDSGSITALGMLAFCYETGSGTKTNKALAAKLYRTAMYRGNETAYFRLKNMYDEIRPKDDIFQIYEED